VPIVHNIVAYAKHRAGSGYRQSIVRRTVILCGLILPGFVANFFIYFFTARLLTQEQFGLYYLASTVGAILLSGSVVLNAFLTRYLVHVGQASGADAIVSAMLRLERHVVTIGAILTTVLFLLFLAAMKQIGVQSPIIILLIILDSYASYVADLGRVLLQSQGRTLALGIYSSTWMALRLGFCIVGALLFETVWGVYCGSVLSTTLAFVAFHFWTLRTTDNRASPASVHLPVLALLPSVAGYGLMVLVSNLDVLFGYYVLSQSDLGAYSASSVFPKAALVVIMPLLQMLIPAMMGVDLSRRSFFLVVARIGGIILALSLSGSVLVWLLSHQLCGGHWGLKLCEPPILGILLISVIPLSLLRTLVVIEFARGRELLLLWLAVPAVAYSLFIWVSSPTMKNLAVGFSAFSFIAFVFFVAVCLIAHIQRFRSVTRSRTL
jgi:O-antigen/teichoic acid export membrane protein